jgi:hypothetical protein
MNQRKLTNYAIIIITILSAKLLEEYILTLLPNLNSYDNPYKSIGMRMLLMVFVFYPVLILLDKSVKNVSKHYIKTSKMLSGSGLYGLLFGFLIAIAILYVLFAKVWYNMQLIKF